MTKSQTSKNTSSSREAVSRYSGIASKRSISSLTGDRYRTVEEFDPTKEHDEMLTRLAEIKSLKDELENEEKVIKTNLEKIYFLIRKMEMFLRFITHKMRSFM